MRSIVVMLLAIGCGSAPAPERAEPVPSPADAAPPPIEPAPDPADAAPAPPAPLDVPWDPPTGPLSPPEAALAGTWVARVAPPHIESRALAGHQMLQVDTTGKDPIQAILDAAKDPSPVPSSCYWMELRADRTGFWSACALIGGEPKALERVDPLTGTKGPFGHALQWTHDQDARTTRIRFAEALRAPHPERGWVPIHHLELRFLQQRGEGIDVEQRFPEVDLTQARPTVWEVYPGQFLGGG